MDRKIDRFDKYMKAKGLNDNKVTVQVNLAVGTLGKSRKPNRDLSDKSVEQILNFYTDLNRVWLLTGEGEMLRASVVQTGSNNNNQQGNGNSYNSSSALDKALDSIAEQIQITKKSQQQIDRLLAVIEKMQGIEK